MIVTGVPLPEVEMIVRAVSETKYRNNVGVRDSKQLSRNRCQFTMRVVDAVGAGARGASMSSGTGPRGKRRNPLSACWHVHYDVLETLFRHFPQAKVQSGWLRVAYTADNFHREAIGTAGRNVGSMMQPAYMTELCECEHWTDEQTQRAVFWTYGAPYFPAPLREDETLGKYASNGRYEREFHACPEQLRSLTY